MSKGHRLVAWLVTAALILIFTHGMCAQTRGVAPSPATDGRLARLEQQTAGAKSSADNAWMLTNTTLAVSAVNPGFKDAQGQSWRSACSTDEAGRCHD